MIFSASLLSTYCFAAKEVTVTKTNGGKNGYASVTEKHTESLFSETHRLNCVDPGSTACAWVNQPMISSPNGGVITSTSIELIVEAQISSGTTSGSGQLNGLSYNWQGLNAENYQLQIICP